MPIRGTLPLTAVLCTMLISTTALAAEPTTMPTPDTSASPPDSAPPPMHAVAAPLPPLERDHAVTHPSTPPLPQDEPGRRPLRKDWRLWTSVGAIVVGCVTTGVLVALRKQGGDGPVPAASNGAALLKF